MENAARDGVREECEITSLSLEILFQEARHRVKNDVGRCPFSEHSHTAIPALSDSGIGHKLRSSVTLGAQGNLADWKWL